MRKAKLVAILIRNNCYEGKLYLHIFLFFITKSFLCQKMYAIFLVTALFAIPIPVSANEIVGRVVGVTDGDTIVILDDSRKEYRIRLAQIDAPEKRQPFSDRSKQSLSDLVFEKRVRVEVVDTDRYGRTVGSVMVGSVDVNLEQVKRGMAWVYRKYARNPRYLIEEGRAREKKIGLWADPSAEPPWEFRKKRRAGTEIQTR